MTVDPAELDEFKQLGKRDQRKPCGVAIAAAQVSEDYQARVLAAFESDDEDVRRGVRRWLRDQDIEPPNDSAAAHHRRQRCACHA